MKAAGFGLLPFFIGIEDMLIFSWLTKIRPGTD
jgi:hypothetical protein